MIVGQSNFLQALGWAVLNSLWQMAILWVIYQLITGTFRTAKSSHKSSLAASFLIIGFAWFIFTFFSILAVNPADNGAITSVFITAGGNEQLNNWLHTMLPVASLVYLILLVLPLFYFIRNYRYVQAIRRHQLTKVDVNWRIFVKNVAARMGIKKPVHIWLSGIVTSPVTIGYIKPVILLPLAAINQLTTQQIEAVLLHELAHIRRYDYFINLVIRFIQSVLYFNPFVKALVKIVEREREKSCDEMVIQFQYDPYGYASALLVLEKTNYLPKPLAVAVSGKKNDLLHRIEWMLGVQKKQVISFNKLAGLLAGLLCFITLNALLILSKPAKAPGAVSSLTYLSSPFYLFTDGEGEETKPVAAPKEMPATAIVNHIQPKAEYDKTIASGPVHEPALPAVPVSSKVVFSPLTYTYVNYTEPINIPQLKNYQEEQVKEVLDASKKVLEEKQWKAMENKIADVMTSHEKTMLKDQYEKELSKVDWNKMKDKLRMAYDKIDWNLVNDNLAKAMTEIKMDSLQQVYTSAMTELSSIQKQLCENNLTGIPDTDISLKVVEETKKNVQTAINDLIKVKTRKIIHL
jgi:bla regulator protein BlaR1